MRLNVEGKILFFNEIISFFFMNILPDLCHNYSLVKGNLAIGGTFFITLSPNGSSKSSILKIQ
jgi:hypothetical protein